MKCARLKLQQRAKQSTRQRATTAADRPRHYCQQLLANPGHEEDSRWSEVLERFNCHLSENSENSPSSEYSKICHQKDTYLTVQNLKFLGNQQQRRRPRTSFKYKTLTDGEKHRMFVKQEVQNGLQADDDEESQLTCYYLEDYSRYIISPTRSRPTSGRLIQTIIKQHKAVQTEVPKPAISKKVHKQLKAKDESIVKTENDRKTEVKDHAMLEDTKIEFHTFGNRKSLTLSRAQSPETVQVIRVDVVCNNYSTSSVISDNEDQKHSKCERVTPTKPPSKSNEDINVKNCYYANKYLLTNSYKKFDQNVAGGTKVTLHCKTFRLLDRSKLLDNKNSK